MVNNEKGIVYPLTLWVAIIAFLIISETAIIYVSEVGYVTELKEYYEREVHDLLMPNDEVEEVEVEQLVDEDDEAGQLIYNGDIDISIEMNE